MTRNEAAFLSATLSAVTALLIPFVAAASGSRPSLAVLGVTGVTVGFGVFCLLLLRQLRGVVALWWLLIAGWALLFVVTVALDGIPEATQLGHAGVRLLKAFGRWSVLALPVYVGTEVFRSRRSGPARLRVSLLVCAAWIATLALASPLASAAPDVTPPVLVGQAGGVILLIVLGFAPMGITWWSLRSAEQE